jgi:hypothetical protein
MTLRLGGGALAMAGKDGPRRTRLFKLEQFWSICSNRGVGKGLLPLLRFGTMKRLLSLVGCDADAAVFGPRASCSAWRAVSLVKFR